MIGVIFNPHAGGNLRQPDRAERFAQIVAGRGEVAVTGSTVELEGALSRFRDRGIEVLAICGGDGSLYLTLAKAIEVWGEDSVPRLLVLGAGTINNISKSLMPPAASPEATLERVVAGLRVGDMPSTRRHFPIRINGDKYGHIVGAGMVVRFLELYYAGARPGPMSALRLLVHLGVSWIFGTAMTRRLMKPFDATVECDGKPLAFSSFSILLASSVEHIGLGVRPFYRNRPPGRAFHLLAGPSSIGQLLVHLPRFFRGRPARLASLHDGSASRVLVRFAQPQRFTIDGELLEATALLELETGPPIDLVV